MTYNEYINNSPYWQKVRHTKYKMQNGRCGKCHCQLYDRFDCHHISYDHLGKELEALETVICLCRSCHDKAHADGPVMPFGKYKGVPVSEIETKYLKWLLQNVTIRNDKIRHAIMGQLGLDGLAIMVAKVIQ